MTEPVTPMTRLHTAASIASEAGVDPRTVKRWLKKAGEDHGDIGALSAGAVPTRYFSDAEKELLLSYQSVRKAIPQPSAVSMAESLDLEITSQAATNQVQTNPIQGEIIELEFRPANYSDAFGSAIAQYQGDQATAMSNRAKRRIARRKALMEQAALEAVEDFSIAQQVYNQTYEKLENNAAAQLGVEIEKTQPKSDPPAS